MNDEAFKQALASKLLQFQPSSVDSSFYQSVGQPAPQMDTGAQPLNMGNLQQMAQTQLPQGQMAGGGMAQGSPPMMGGATMQGPPPAPPQMPPPVPVPSAPPVAPVMPVPKPMMADQYVVRPGDTLSAIAKRFGTTVRAIADKNGIKNPNMIIAGKTITL